MTPEAQAAAVAAADQLGATHHVEHCPRCQWVIRVPVDALRTSAAETPAEAPMLLATPEAPLLLEAALPAPETATARKPAAKKAVTKKKPAARKAVVKKSAAKKAPAKKAAAKKPAKKAATKKAATKKPAAKRKK
jgi:hypothetical protein